MIHNDTANPGDGSHWGVSRNGSRPEILVQIAQDADQVTRHSLGFHQALDLAGALLDAASAIHRGEAVRETERMQLWTIGAKAGDLLATLAMRGSKERACGEDPDDIYLIQLTKAQCFSFSSWLVEVAHRTLGDIEADMVQEEKA